MLLVCYFSVTLRKLLSFLCFINHLDASEKNTFAMKTKKRHSIGGNDEGNTPYHRF